MAEQLSTHVKKRLAKAAQTAATTAVVSDIFDMSGFRGVEFFGTIAVANAGNHLQVLESDAANMANPVTLAAKAVAGANGDVVSVDVYRPKRRYVQATITRTASTATGDLYVQQYGPTRQPVDNNEDDEIVTVSVVSPGAAA